MRTCKGYCELFRIHKPKRQPYKHYIRCTVCSDSRDNCWWDKSFPKCPCCGAMCRRKPTSKSDRKKYIVLVT